MHGYRARKTSRLPVWVCLYSGGGYHWSVLTTASASGKPKFKFTTASWNSILTLSFFFTTVFYHCNFNSVYHSHFLFYHSVLRLQFQFSLPQPFFLPQRFTTAIQFSLPQPFFFTTVFYQFNSIQFTTAIFFTTAFYHCNSIQFTTAIYFFTTAFYHCNSIQFTTAIFFTTVFYHCNFNSVCQQMWSCRAQSHHPRA